MAYQLSDITGALVLNWVNKTSIGGFNEADINQDITVKGDGSTPGFAIFAFGQIAAKAQVDPGAFTVNQTTLWNGALMWYICALYEDFNMKEQPCEKCCDNEFERRNIYYRKACEFLGLINTELQNVAGFCVDAPSGELDADTFGSRYYDDCGCEDNTITEFPYDLPIPEGQTLNYTFDFLV